MKLFKIFVSMAGIAGLVLLMACEKKFEYIINPDTDVAEEKALVRVYNGALSTTANFVYVDNVSINGNALIYPSLFPSSAPYSALAPGSRSFLIKDTNSATIQNPLTFNASLEAGKKYTIFTYDTVTSVKQVMVTDNIVVPTDTTVRLRFANLVFSSSAIPNVDVYSQKLNSVIFSDVAIGNVTNFIPYPSAYGDTLFVRETGTTTSLFQLNNVNYSKQRNYTLVFRGRLESTSGTLAKTLTSFASY